MKLTYKQILRAYLPINQIADIRLTDLDKSRLISKWRKALTEESQFYSEEQSKIAREHDGIIDEEGLITFGSIEEKRAYKIALNELDKSETEIELGPVYLGKNLALSLSANDLDALEGIVIFED